MSFSWKELVCIGISKNIHNNDIMRYILNIIMKERRDYLDAESIIFQKSLETHMNSHKKLNQSVYFIDIFNEMYIDLWLDCLSTKLLVNQAEEKQWEPRKANFNEKIFIYKNFIHLFLNKYPDEIKNINSKSCIILNVKKLYKEDPRIQHRAERICHEYSKIQSGFPIGYDIFITIDI